MGCVCWCCVMCRVVSWIGCLMWWCCGFGWVDVFRVLVGGWCFVGD